MQYNMEEFLMDCIAVYKRLTGVTKLRKVSTPFIHEPSSSSGGGGSASAPGKGEAVYKGGKRINLAPEEIDDGSDFDGNL